jgi:hypothetical protein
VLHYRRQVLGLREFFNGYGCTVLLMQELTRGTAGDLQAEALVHGYVTLHQDAPEYGGQRRRLRIHKMRGIPFRDGFHDFSIQTGGLEVYDIRNNQLAAAAFIGTVGLDWQFAGIAPVHAAGASDLVLRNVNTGQFEVYDIAGNTLVGAASLGTVGVDWQLGGFAPTFSVPPPRSEPAAMDGSTAQLVQAMAGFGGGSGAADSLNIAPLGAEASQQPLLTTPQHA